MGQEEWVGCICWEDKKECLQEKRKQELKDWWSGDAFNAGHVQEARSPVCVFLRVGRVRWGGKWKLLSVWVVMVTQELCMTFLFGKIRIFLDGTLRTCLCHWLFFFSSYFQVSPLFPNINCLSISIWFCPQRKYIFTVLVANGLLG